MSNKNDQGIVRDERGQEQPADKARAQHVTSVEEKKKPRMKSEKPQRKAGFRTEFPIHVLLLKSRRRPWQ